jgi:hypothetical protein
VFDKKANAKTFILQSFSAERLFLKARHFLVLFLGFYCAYICLFVNICIKMFSAVDNESIILNIYFFVVWL